MLCEQSFHPIYGAKKILLKAFPGSFCPILDAPKLEGKTITEVLLNGTAQILEQQGHWEGEGIVGFSIDDVGWQAGGLITTIT